MTQAAESAPNKSLILKEVEVLLADDNPADVRFLLECLRELGIANRVTTVADGQACLDFLLRQGEYSDVPRPDLVFLDTRMPKVGGVEVYVEMKANPVLADIPIMVLTGCKAETEFLKFVGLHPDCYIEKPASVTQLVQAFECFKHLSMYVVSMDKIEEPTATAS